MWLDVIEKESLQEMRSVDLKRDLFDEGSDVNLVKSNFILDELISELGWVVQVKSINGCL